MGPMSLTPPPSKPFGMLRISAGPLSASSRTFKGPEFVWGEVPGEGIRLEERQPVRLQTMLARSGGQLGHQSLAASGMIELPVTYQHLAQDVRPGLDSHQ